MNLVSVLMPALNEEQHIAKAIEGVLAQAEVDVEVLAILAPSVDNTEEVVKKLAAKDSRVRLLHNPKAVIPAALNIGLDAASGEFIARVDAHCTISPGYLARAIWWMRQNERLVSVGGLRTGVANTPTGRAIALAISSPFAIGDSVNHYGTEPQLTDHASMAVTRTKAARVVYGWDETLQVNEDVDFDHRLREAGGLIGFDPAMRTSWQVQESIPSLFRQFRRYGRGKGQMVRKNGPAALRKRHLVPPAFVAGSVLLVAGSLARPLLLVALLPYLGAVAYGSKLAWRYRINAPTSAAALPLSFMAIHTAWGLGMIEGSLGMQPARASGNSTVRR